MGTRQNRLTNRLGEAVLTGIHNLQLNFFPLKFSIFNAEKNSPHIARMRGSRKFSQGKTGMNRGIPIYSYFCSKTQCVGTRKNHLAEAIVTGTHNQCFE